MVVFCKLCCALVGANTKTNHAVLEPHILTREATILLNQGEPSPTLQKNLVCFNILVGPSQVVSNAFTCIA